MCKRKWHCSDRVYYAGNMVLAVFYRVRGKVHCLVFLLLCKVWYNSSCILQSISCVSGNIVHVHYMIFTLSESLSAWFYMPPQLLDVYRYRILCPYFVLFQFFVFLIMLMKHKTIFWVIFSSLCFQKLVFIITSLGSNLWKHWKKQFPLGYLEHKYTKTNFKMQ